MKALITNTIHSQLESVPLQLTTSFFIGSAVERKYHLMQPLRNGNLMTRSLIRLQFDVEDVLQVRNPRPMNVDALRAVLALHLVRSGIRDVEHPTAPVPNSAARVRKSTSLSKGFRKRAISIFIEAGLNHEIRELVCDHATQLDQFYFRPTEAQVLQEYLKAEPLLCIDQSLRLQSQIETLKVERSSWEELRKEVSELKALLKND